MSTSESGPGGSNADTPRESAPTQPETATSTRQESTPTKTSQTSKKAKGTTDDPLRGSRTSGVWLAVVLSGIILVLLIIFIAQNTDPVNIRFLGWEGETPLAVAILAATVAGLFLAAVAGSLRILQLRRRVKRDR